MSAFAALTGFDGEQDIAAEARKRRLKQIQDEREQKESIKAHLDNVVKNGPQGNTNWADDSDDDDFLPPGLRNTIKPTTADADRLPADAADAAAASTDDDDDDDDDDESQGGGEGKAADGPQTIEVPAKPKRVKAVDAAKLEEQRELDALLAKLDVADDKANGAGLSKAAAKRARKKAEATATGGATAAAAAAASSENAPPGDAGEPATANKSPEEVKALLKARAEAAKKAKGKKGAPASSAAAMAAAEAAKREKKKKAKDKSSYNQIPG